MGQGGRRFVLMRLLQGLRLPTRGKIGESRGAAAVEFVLIAGVLIFLVFALLELGMLLSTRIVLIQAARAGVRQAVIDGGASVKAVEVIQKQLRDGGLDPNRFDVTIIPRHASYGTIIRVTLAHDYPLKTPLIRALGRQSLRFTVSLLGRSENLGGEGN